MIGRALETLLVLLECRYLRRAGWTRSENGIWWSPRGVRMINTPLGCVGCLRFDALHYQRHLEQYKFPAEHGAAGRE